jgi:UDP-N-acetylglucosamine--N-acetylmuramyl-(pentapeptide) pyrophosphoryl-undecaprenol N-acetylglucosamine transferase
VLCRAGATTIAEITYFGVPAILVPYPFATANHQFENARVLFESGASELLLDAELKMKLREKIFNLLNDEERLEKMRQKVREFANPDAGVRIAKSILKLAGRDDV